MNKILDLPLKHINTFLKDQARKKHCTNKHKIKYKKTFHIPLNDSIGVTPGTFDANCDDEVFFR